MSTEVAHKRWWQIFEVVFGIPLFVAIVLQFVVPLSFPRGSFTPLFILAGALLTIMGVILVILARRELAQHDQPTDPGLPTNKLVTTGVFSISRNPLYLGGSGLLLGITLLLNFPWGLLLLLPAIVACHYLLIMPEERYLAAKFGESYRVYATSVRRWLGRRDRPERSFDL